MRVKFRSGAGFVKLNIPGFILLLLHVLHAITRISLKCNKAPPDEFSSSTAPICQPKQILVLVRGSTFGCKNSAIGIRSLEDCTPAF
eukprot:1136949-Pelagomonas_calceolata.AAC.14